jgi:uncharacterized protein with von Willebrand factor type A (vWA) domain
MEGLKMIGFLLWMALKEAEDTQMEIDNMIAKHNRWVDNKIKDFNEYADRKLAEFDRWLKSFSRSREKESVNHAKIYNEKFNELRTLIRVDFRKSTDRNRSCSNCDYANHPFSDELLDSGAHVGCGKHRIDISTDSICKKFIPFN